MRIFIAIRFTDAFKQPLLNAQKALRQNGVKGEFTRPENLHLTLVFIGETNRVDDIKAAVNAINFEAFEIKTGKLGSFTNRNKILWVGVDGETQLKTIATELRKNLDERGIEYSPREFQPHITLVRSASDISDIDIERASMTVKQISVMKSDFISGKPVYTEV